MVHIYQFKREARLEEITELVKNMKRDGDLFDRKKIIVAIMSKYNTSQRTASEYLKIAEFRNG